MTPSHVHVRLRSAVDRNKAFGIYNELRKSGRVARALIVAEMHDGSWQVLGSGMTPDQMGGALLVGAEGLKTAADRREEVRLEPPTPMPYGERSGDAPIRKRVTKALDGTMEPPPGENFTSCGECFHPRWYMTSQDIGGALARMVCAACGNEVALFQEEPR